jgi:hypothetical protein
MRSIHDCRYKTDIERRLRELRPDSQRRWGKMSVGQMLWHVNEAMDAALGHVQLPPVKLPVPRALLKFIVMNMPWGEGAPTYPQWVARNDFDFSTERERCLSLVDQFARRPLEDKWPASPMLGPMRGHEVTRLQAKHLDHHLKQFGV